MPLFDPSNPQTDDTYYALIAEDMVFRLAPEPTPVAPATTVDPDVQADYNARAERAEKLLFDWLSSTEGGSITSAGNQGGSVALTQLKVVQDIVRQTMGTYFKGSTPVRITRKHSTASNPTFYVDRWGWYGPYWTDKGYIYP